MHTCAYSYAYTYMRVCVCVYVYAMTIGPVRFIHDWQTIIVFAHVIDRQCEKNVGNQEDCWWYYMANIDTSPLAVTIASVNAGVLNLPMFHTK